MYKYKRTSVILIPLLSVSSFLNLIQASLSLPFPRKTHCCRQKFAGIELSPPRAWLRWTGDGVVGPDSGAIEGPEVI